MPQAAAQNFALRDHALSFPDTAAFERARAFVLSESAEKNGIGCLSEKTMHRILKCWLEPDERFHEVDFLGSVADIKNESGVTEVQTRSLSRLVPKLEKFLPETPVRVIYPLPFSKILRQIDPASGEISPPRKSPKRATVFDAVYELYPLRFFLSDPHFSLWLVFLHVEEYRRPSEKKRKRSYERLECIPNRVEKILTFNKKEDYLAFLPDGLPEVFTAPMYQKAISPRFRYAYSAIRLLLALGLIETCGKIGRATAYRIIY